MKTRSILPKTKKLTKPKNLVIRVSEALYDFISEKSKQKGITKTDYIFSQIDEESEIIEHINDKLIPQLEQEANRLKEEGKKLKEENKKIDKMILEGLKNLDQDQLSKLYKDESADWIRNKIKSVAESKGFTLQI